MLAVPLSDTRLLVVFGNHQVKGEDYNAFALIAYMATVHCILTIAISKAWNLHQMDVHMPFFMMT